MTSSIHNLFSELILPWAQSGAAPAQGMDGTTPEFLAWLEMEADEQGSPFDVLARVEKSQWHWCEVRFDGFDGPFFFYAPRLWMRVEHHGRQALLGRPKMAGHPLHRCQSIFLMPRADWAPALSRLLESHRVTAFYFEPLAPGYCQWLFATAPKAKNPPFLWSAWGAGDTVVVSQGEAWTPEQGRQQISSMLLSSPWQGWIEAGRAQPA